MRINQLEGDSWLTHFTKSGTALNHILPSLKLRLSPLSEVSDPMENKEMSIGWKYMPRYKDFKPPKYYLDTDVTKADTLIDEYFRRHSKIACFCRNENGNSYHKPRMWDQYADNYKGVCLVLNHEELMSTLGEMKVRHMENYVSYLDFNNKYRYEAINYNTRKYLYKDSNPIITIMCCLMRIMFQKETDYRDENEFRIIVVDENEDYIYLDIANSLTAIIVGCDISRENWDRIYKFCQDKHICLFEQKLVNRQTHYVDWDFSKKK